MRRQGEKPWRGSSKRSSSRIARDAAIGASTGNRGRRAYSPARSARRASCGGSASSPRASRESTGPERRSRRAFAVDQKNKLRVGGITRVPTKEGRPCLAAAMDAFSRKAAGWSMPGRITEKITTGATGQAIGREAPKRQKPRLP